ncbi:MAG: tRNA threonylcarbamoyladenosine dehydratase [Prevotella sp.]|nr:tRNA threonylcarbamoyladenosine dehydratase [Prevotella sp.]
MTKEIFNRVERLLGADVMRQIETVKVIIFGVGGVGSWCAETLIRSGIENLTIVDFDRVGTTNINRQLMATTETVGEVKVEALKRRLKEINPRAEIRAIKSVYNEETAGEFQLAEYDYVVDAIDSLKDKMLLMMKATEAGVKTYSSMGAALKLDPTKIQVAEFWKVKGCPLAKALREKFKKAKTRPRHKITCVFSEELLSNRGEAFDDGTDTGVIRKAQVNGSLVHITGIYGMTLAGLIIKDIDEKAQIIDEKAH